MGGKEFDCCPGRGRKDKRKLIQAVRVLVLGAILSQLCPIEKVVIVGRENLEGRKTQPVSSMVVSGEGE